MSTPWTTTSWLNCPNPQAPVYKDKQHLTAVLDKLGQKEPLVSVAPILQLKRTLALAGMGHAFILQGGDCAESFEDCRPAVIRAQTSLMHQMMQILMPALGKPIIPIGRIAGQYAKPRSSEYETKGDITLPSYRGDLINASAFNAKAREPNPNRLLKGYASAKHTLGFIQKAQKNHAFYTSHEALHLHYEAALTHRGKNGLWYNLSTHLPWVGVRTTQLDGAHIEFLRGINNPIGIKIGPKTTPDALVQLIQTLNPEQEAGRILLITRLGIKHIAHVLPQLIQTTQAHKMAVTWSCDPMHGNTEITAEGIKTRHTDNIWQELKQALMIHQAHQSHLGGVHLEITPEPVTECLGGIGGPTEHDLKKAYKSLLDPRLNQAQSLELASKLGQFYLR
ncbi:MAG: 3-deoxy-7-phosphoheptulonate synthase [Legionellaceae bacterium]|nr:3-deoxy-7-phosphoheptulonate synthase [Legionellaceae bacterium]